MSSPPRVILVDLDAESGEVEARLREGGFPTTAAPDPAAALELCESDSHAVLVVPCSRLAETREAILDGSLANRAGVPVLALCGSATPASLEEARALADDVLPWPEGVQRLGRAIEVLAARAAAKRELAFRRASAQALQEIAVLLGTDDDLEFLIGDVLGRVAGASGATRVFLVVLRPGHNLYYIAADTDEAAGITVPVPKEDLPEIAECVESQHELLLLGDAGDPLGEALVRRGIGALLVEPLVYEGQVYAVLEVEAEEGGAGIGGWDGGAITPAFLDLVGATAAILGQALYGSDFHLKIGEQTKVTPGKIRQEKDERTESLKKYKEFFQRAFDGFVVLDQERRILHINPAGEQITGYARQGLVGQRVDAFVLENDRPVLDSIMKEMRTGRLARSFDLGLITPSGEPIVVSVSPSAVLANEEALVLSFRDVTEARNLENQLRGTKDFLERLVDSAVDAIIATDTQGYMVLFNKGAERIFGASAEEVIGKRAFSDLFAPGEAAKALEQLHGQEGAGRVEAARMEALGAAKEPIPVSLSANLLYEDGVEIGLVAIVSDLRERLLMEQRLVQVQEKLVETEKQALIAELAGTAAHELNQPLTSVMGYAELLKRKIPESDSNRRAAEVIIREAERMAEIVRKIGRITKYEVKSYVGSTQILDLEKSSGGE